MEHIGYSWPTFDALTQQVSQTIQPKRILDIGAGGGKYGALLKSVVPDCEFTALECDEAAFPQLREVGYDHILPITADRLVERGGDLYDVVIMGDVIEHMLHPQGRDLLEFLNYRSRYILISTPECMPMSRPVFFEGTIRCGGPTPSPGMTTGRTSSAASCISTCCAATTIGRAPG